MCVIGISYFTVSFATGYSALPLGMWKEGLTRRSSLISFNATLLVERNENVCDYSVVIEYSASFYSAYIREEILVQCKHHICTSGMK
eukprot:CFRG8367T1